MSTIPTSHTHTLSECGHPVGALCTISGCDVENDKPTLLRLVHHLEGEVERERVRGVKQTHTHSDETCVMGRMRGYFQSPFDKNTLPFGVSNRHSTPSEITNTPTHQPTIPMPLETYSKHSESVAQLSPLRQIHEVCK